jgi:hypothetical protein
MAIGVGITTKAVVNPATSATTGTVTTTAGSTVVLAVVCQFAATFTSIGDNKSNTYTLIGSQQSDAGNNFWGRLYYCSNISGGAGHTFNVVVSASVAITLLVVEITGAATAAFDKTAQQVDTASAFTSTATATTTQAAEMLIGFVAGDSGSNPATHAISGATPAGGWTIQAAAEETNGVNDLVGCLATNIVASTGAYESGFTESGATLGLTWIATFKETASDVLASQSLLW